jgi:prepilin-type N-terminal cleavage/methylation domain-containing protein
MDVGGRAMPGAFAEGRVRGFTYLELVVVIAIISTLLYVAMDRFLQLQVTAEQAVVDQTVGNLQSALALTIAEHVAHDDIPGLKQYVGGNPVRLLAQTPLNYHGYLAGAHTELPGGAWYYRTDTKSLIYKVANPEYFTSVDNDLAEITFKIYPVYDDNNHNGRFDAGDTLKGLTLRSVHPYRWLREARQLPVSTKTN